jgi:hypothetical protein
MNLTLVVVHWSATSYCRTEPFFAAASHTQQ